MAVISGNEGWRRSIYGVDDVHTLAVRVPVKSIDGVITYPPPSKAPLGNKNINVIYAFIFKSSCIKIYLHMYLYEKLHIYTSHNCTSPSPTPRAPSGNDTYIVCICIHVKNCIHKNMHIHT